MFNQVRLILYFLTIIMLFLTHFIYAKGVQVSNVQITNVGAEYCTINYTLTRPSETISVSNAVWIFVKYRLSTEDDYTGWKDTDDLYAYNDASDVNTSVRNATVNANLTGDVNVVSSGGSKSILWHYAGSGGIGNGTGIPSGTSVKVRIYAIEITLIPGENVAFREDPGYTNNILTGTTSKCGNDFYIMRYPVTVEMYKDFLNAAANRHDDPAAVDSVHDYFTQNSYHGTVYNGSDLRNMLYSLDSKYGVLQINGVVGVNAQWEVYNGDGQSFIRRNFPMNHLTWFNCFDFAAWCGLSMLEEEHFYKVASENGQSINYWGNSLPNTGICNFLESGIGGPSDVTQYEDSVNNIDGGPFYRVYELAGNVWEWTSTSGDNYIGNQIYDPTKGPMSYEDTDNYAIKKGCRWLHDKNSIYAARRYYGLRINRYTPSGFRLGYFGAIQ